MTALLFAAGSGHFEAVKLLVANGADVNARDSFYNVSVLSMAASSENRDMTVFLLGKGAGPADDVVEPAVHADDVVLIKVAIAAGIKRQTLQTALGAANAGKRTAVTPVLKAALDALPPEPAAAAVRVDPSVLATYTGTFLDESAGVSATVAIRDCDLEIVVAGQAPVRLISTAPLAFRSATAAADMTVSFGGRGGMIESMTLNRPGGSITLPKAGAAAELSSAPSSSASAVSTAPRPPAATATRERARDWPSFRGGQASGNGDGQGAVAEWDVDSGPNVKWKTAIHLDPTRKSRSRHLCRGRDSYS